MLPILVILLLVQSLSATNEFPDLMQNIQVSWAGVNITSKIDAGLTSSLDNQVPYFFLCGPFQTYGKDGNCKIESYWEISYSETNITRIRSYWGSNVQLLGSGYLNTFASFTCMVFPNPIPDFMEKKQRTWYVNYTCETLRPIIKPDPKPETKPEMKSESNSMFFYAMGVVVLVIVGFVAFTIGKKKGAENSQDNTSGAYKALGANNKVHGGNPSYGNPFAQTA